MRILVTGSSGFIGRHIADFLAERHDAITPTRKDLDLEDDAAVRSFMRDHPVDAVVHAAVKPGHRNSADPSGQLWSNTRMFFNIARNQDCFKRLVFLSSGLVYDQRFYEPKMKEDRFDAHVPADEAGLSKYIIAKFIEKHPNMTELRPFGVFGPGEDYSIRFISNATCKALLGLPITIKQNRRFDYVHVKDLASAVGHFVSHPGKHRAYNVTPDKSVELLEIAKMVLAVSGKELPIKIAQEGMGQEYSGDNSRLKEETPGVEFEPLETSVRGLYGWYSENQGSVKKELLLHDK